MLSIRKVLLLEQEHCNRSLEQNELLGLVPEHRSHKAFQREQELSNRKTLLQVQEHRMNLRHNQRLL